MVPCGAALELVMAIVGNSWVGGRMGLVTVGDKWACLGDGCLARVGDQWDGVGIGVGDSWYLVGLRWSW